ncbi:MAG: DUF4442 domain-containing protein [Alphaproteobacteria bacterium]|nr:DUF4442 domain-containing protein [Alphaproteobacteria bacterium]
MKRPSVPELWSRLSPLPGGKTLFSKILGRAAPYTGTIDARVTELSPGHAVVTLGDRKAVRNHLNSIHAIALMNLGEVATGLAVMAGVDGRGRGIITHLGMDYTKKARGRITATCDAELPTQPGKHDVEVVATLRDASGDAVATAHARWRVDLT